MRSVAKNNLFYLTPTIFKTLSLPTYRSAYRCTTKKAWINLLYHPVCNDNSPVPSRKHRNWACFIAWWCRNYVGINYIVLQSMSQSLELLVNYCFTILFIQYILFAIFFPSSNSISLQSCTFIVPILDRDDRGSSQLYSSYGYKQK